uniref:Uncharacterized protein n=1 Tax=Arundo donax TaxID=35708 RepID=A0A0A9DYD1_ARUDO
MDHKSYLDNANNMVLATGKTKIHLVAVATLLLAAVLGSMGQVSIDLQDKMVNENRLCHVYHKHKMLN